MITLHSERLPSHDVILSRVSERSSTKSYFTTDCGRRATLIKNMFGLIERQDVTLIRNEFVVWINAECPEIYRGLRISQGLDPDYRKSIIEACKNPTEEEWNYLKACFVYGALALWDITVFFERDEIIVQLDHDECATLWAGRGASRETLSEFRAILKNARRML